MLIKLLKYHSLFILFFATVQINNIYAQDLVDDTARPVSLGDNEELFTEKVKIISKSGKIFILSNSNQLLNKGDFITLILPSDGPISRAVVAKTHDGDAGIKSLKVYSLNRWKKIRKGIDVQILKGDDSSLFVKKVEKKDVGSAIESEEDLFNGKGLGDDDLNDFYKDTRLIKPDNIVSIAWNRYTFANDITKDEEAHNQFSYAWAFQFADNWWAEGLYGRVSISNFPGNGAETIVNNFTVRCKYTFKAPFYSYVMPYIGFQTYSVSSPSAGTSGTDPTRDQKEVDMINKLEVSQIAIGATVLKRLVPGWFLKFTLGTDIVNLGFGIEF